jgi:hypothetical protein
VGREQRFELAVVGEEGLEQILLRPVPLHLLDPFARVLPGQEYVVEVDHHAGLELGQDLEHDVIDIPAGLHGVGRVDEQHVPGGERFEFG